MKRKVIFIVAVIAISLCMAAEASGEERLKFKEASELTLVGKIQENTPNPYHRVDTCRYKGFTSGENIQVRCGAGLAVLFRTDSPVISVLCEYGYMDNAPNTMGVSLRGFDLYIRKDGEWLYANSLANKPGRENENLVLMRDMDAEDKECMLYLPIYSEIRSLRIGVEQSSYILPLESGFRHRIGVFGSSYTQGISTTRAGMSWPMQFMRNTGMQVLSLGCSGNCKLQPYFADVLADADVDAYIFDAFSNPGPEMIRERLFPFIERIQAARPDVPLIFIKSIYRESRNFSKVNDRNEQAKMDMAEKMMKEAVKKYRNVYYVDTTNATTPEHDTSVDGTHPSDAGYKLWARSIEKPVLKILKKYGLK